MAYNQQCAFIGISLNPSNVIKKNCQVSVTEKIGRKLNGKWQYHIISFISRSEFTDQTLDFQLEKLASMPTPRKTEVLEFDYEIWIY